MKNSIILISAIGMLTLASCKSTRSVVKTAERSDNKVVQVIEKIKNVQPQFNTANISKMSLELTMNDRNVNVSATCKIRQDSAIYLSIQPFMGIEMFKIELSTDTLIVVDKMNRKFYRTDYGYLSKLVGMELNFQNVQALLLGQFFCIGSKTILTDSCKLVNEQTLVFENGNLTQSTEIAPLYTIQKVLLKDKIKGFALQTIYSDYAVSSGVNYPQKIEINANSEKAKASCNLSILRAEFNTSIKFIPTNSDRYTLSNIEQLLKK